MSSILKEKSKLAGIVMDCLMFLLLVLQMLYVFTDNTVHEWLGIAMTALMSCFHQGTVCAAATGYFAEKDFS